LGENIADLGGASIAYDAYQRRLAKTGRKTIKGFTPEERFFIGWAQAEREQARPEYLKMIVTVDTHSPSMFRINGPASNMDEFYRAFGVTKRNKLFRPASERAKIW
jgi:putative endopeptidase